MKICRFVTPENPSPQWAIIRGDELLPIDDPFHIAIPPSARSIPLSDARLVAPAQPSKIVCVGRNYRDHAAELGNPMPPEPLLFLKPPSAIIGPDEEIQLPAESDRVEYEGEIAIVIGRKARRLAANPPNHAAPGAPGFSHGEEAPLPSFGLLFPAPFAILNMRWTSSEA